MNATRTHDTPDIVIAATLWLMHRYQQTGCGKLARMVEQHLAWMQDRATHPRLVEAYQRLSYEWRAVASTDIRPVLH